MTLNDIIIAALSELDRGHDPSTIDAFKAKFTRFANEAQNDIAETAGFYRTDTVLPTQGAFDLNELPRSCIKVLKAVQLGHPVRFARGNSSNTILLPYDAPVILTYKCRPQPLANTGDVCELSEPAQSLIVDYVVGRERAAGDASTQRGGNIYLAMYENAKLKLMKSLGDAASYALTDKY